MISGHPKTLLITSEGPAVEELPFVIGVYRKTNVTHSGKPVWINYEHRYGSILYNGMMIMIIIIFNLIFLLYFEYNFNLQTIDQTYHFYQR